MGRTVDTVLSSTLRREKQHMPSSSSTVFKSDRVMKRFIFFLYDSIQSCNPFSVMRLGVKESVDNSRLFITGFDMSISVTEAMEEMKRIAEGVVGLSLGSYNPKIGGTAFVQFESHR